MGLWNESLKAAPAFILQVPLLAWIISGDWKYGWFALMALVFGEFANVGEKYAFRHLGASSWGKRPSGCGTHNGKECVGCGAFSNPGEVSHSWGMPSGHAQITALAACFWTIYLVKSESDDNLVHVIVASVLLWLLAMSVWVQRVMVHCHSIPQVLTGAIFGTGFGVLSYAISQWVFPDKFISFIASVPNRNEAPR